MGELLKLCVLFKLCVRVAVCLIVLMRSIVSAPPESLTDVQSAATALIMGGTNQVLSIGPASPDFLQDFVDEANAYYIEPTGLCKGSRPGCSLAAVYTPEQLRPFTGLTDMTFDASVAEGAANLADCLRGIACTVTTAPYTNTGLQKVVDSSYVVLGISQSAIIASHVKAALIAQPADSTVSFVLVSNQGRPNGGLLERFVGAYIPYLGISFTGATPTDSSPTQPLLTVDVARQYDGWTDFPTNPLNMVATLNALLGALFLHDDYLYSGGPPLLQGYYQDTTYYLGPTTVLPLLIPLSQIPVVGMALAKALDPPLRVLVETGYDRTINPGQPTPARYTYFPNPFKTLVDFAIAIPTGWDDAISYVTGGGARPFGTAVQPIYGVGGPPVYAGAVDPYIETDAESINPAEILRPRQPRSESLGDADSDGHNETSPSGYAGKERGYRTNHDDPRNRATSGEGLSHRGVHRR